MVNIDDLANEITSAVREYTEDVSVGIEKKVDEVAKDVLKETRNLAPKLSGEYANSFKITRKVSFGSSKRIIWNKKHYRRVHLLEMGHAKVNGGRVPSYPHLRPAYEKHAANLDEEIKDIIRNGGKR